MNADGPAALHPLAALLRRFALQFLACQDWSVLQEVMADDYRLEVGGHVIAGRDEAYRPAMRVQFGQFPGLGVTVHEVLLADDAMAMRFTEHGASRRDGGRAAAWQGVSLFQVRKGRLQSGWAEEDYLARKRQLRTGVCDPLERPHRAPWDAQPEAADPEAASVARRWLLEGRAIEAAARPEDPDPPPAALLDAASTAIDAFVCAGRRVAFHVTHRGTYAGGFGDADSALTGSKAELRAAGIITVENGSVVGARVVTDRLGLRRSLQTA